MLGGLSGIRIKTSSASCTGGRFQSHPRHTLFFFLRNSISQSVKLFSSSLQINIIKSTVHISSQDSLTLFTCVIIGLPIPVKRLINHVDPLTSSIHVNTCVYIYSGLVSGLFLSAVFFYIMLLSNRFHVQVDGLNIRSKRFTGSPCLFASLV